MAQVTVERAVQVAHECHAAGRGAEAEHLCRQILTARPDCGPALNLLGILAFGAGQVDLAGQLFRRSVAVSPTTAEFHANLGNALSAGGQHGDAVAAYRAALAIAPNLAAVHSNLGSCLSAQGDTDGAVDAFGTALRLNPNLAEAHSNLGNALVDAGRVGDAVDAYRAAVALAPDHAGARWNLATGLLLSGDLAAGWPAFEWRLRGGGGGRRFAQPLWAGDDLAGRTILLHAEQGLGDTIQFARYAPLVAGRGGRVVVECQPALIPLLRQLPRVAAWVPVGEPLPPFDVHCPLLSLPVRFGTTLATVPLPDPPLRAPADRAERWRGRFDGGGVGLVWAGNGAHANDPRRSVPLATLAPLIRSGGRFVSLQVGPAGAEARMYPELVDVGRELRDFADTAAVIEQLDRVITVDTAVAHLAAAMGKPTWVLLPFSPDWRWLVGRDDSPWYPTARLFRQRRPGDWPDVVGRVVDALGRRRDGPARGEVRGRGDFR